jgi:hypothetical protein
MEQAFIELLEERLEFEIELYDYLVSPLIPDSFWEPVKVSFKNVKELEDSIHQDECSVCMEKHINFKKLVCCNQEICNDCCYTWFDKSVICPYCNQDIREFNLKKKR